MMGTDYSSMMGANGGGMMAVGWITFILLIILIALGIAALWKYLKK